MNSLVSGDQVAILLGTYNGDRFLKEQLESFRKQTHKNFCVYASDDGSSDNTLSLLQDFSDRTGKLNIIKGPKKGFCANFFSLINDKSIQSDYYAFSDQDDIWMPEKVERAIRALGSFPNDKPSLYCGRTYLVDELEKPLGMSPLFSKPPSFANALMQNIGGGNTMVINNAARKLLLSAGRSINVISHDWWAYLAITGCGGNVVYDKEPALYYRQHSQNIVGSNSSWTARLIRIKELMRGRFHEWNTLNLEALKKIHPQLTRENQKILNQFSTARSKTLLPRTIGFIRSGIHRQTVVGNLGLIAATMLGKI